MGFFATVALGIAGSFLGGFLASLLLEGELELRGSGLIGSILGAILILLLGRLFARSSRRHGR
ncbi:MAG: GlsB/YeaQ/YmgE family stress response membrane protein [Actinomycetota bacterium]|nr:GlsB/YeaQ/YmgE family stress response membrane protein [Actinomycetota bacterium]